MSALDGLFGITRIIVDGEPVIGEDGLEAFEQTLNLLGGWTLEEGVDDDDNPTLELTAAVGAAEVDAAAYFPIMVISAQHTVLDATHYGKHLVFTHATPDLTVNTGLTPGKLIVGTSTAGALTFVAGTAAIRKSSLWGLATSGAYAPFSLKVYLTGEVFLGGELAEA